VSIKYVYTNPQPPETLTVNVSQGASGLDLSTVTGVSFSVRYPDTTADVTWTASIVSQTSTLLTARHTFNNSVAGEAVIPGTYRVMVALDIPGGTKRAGPTFFEVYT
jgi:hypothetical protein